MNIKKNNLIQFIAITLFILIISSPLYAITKILGGNVDATPPITPPAPSGGSLLSSSAVYGSTSGSFYGITATVVKTSSDGITWTNTPSQPALTGFYGIKQNGGRVIVVRSTGASGCTIYYSDNGGSSWSTASIPSGTFECSDYDQRQNLKCSGTTCFIAAEDSGSNLRVWRSTDNGATWTNVHTASGYDNSGAQICYYDGTNVLVCQGFVSPCASGNETVVISIDNGNSWTTIDPESDCYTHIAATKIGNTFYILMNPQASGAVRLRTSDNNWTTIIDPTFSPAVGTEAFNYSLIYLGNYNPPTAYMGYRDAANNDGYIYSSENMTSWTRIYQYTDNVVSDLLIGNFVESNNNLYFGTIGNKYHKLQ